MLLKIRDYLAQQGVASNQQIAREFQIDEQALQPMLDLWLQKQIIICCDHQTSCKTACFKCKTPPKYYQYVG